jgi:hypothetical protein
VLVVVLEITGGASGAVVDEDTTRDMLMEKIQKY